MNDKRAFHKFLGLLLAYWLSEAVYLVERRIGSAPDPEKIYRNVAGVLMVQWMQTFVQNMPDDHAFTPHRARVFHAFMYGCNPLRVAEAVRAGKAIVPYCLRYRDGLC